MADAAVRLRAMRADDFPAVSDLWVEAWAATYPAIDFEARRPWFAAHMAALAEGGAQRVVAVAGTEVAGLVTLDPSTGYLDQIVVARRFHGRGVAELLLAEAQQLSPGSVTLDVNRDNDRAVRFYEKQGFLVVGEHNNDRGAPIYRMRWVAPGTDAAEATPGAAPNCSRASRA